MKLLKILALVALAVFGTGCADHEFSKEYPYVAPTPTPPPPPPPSPNMSVVETAELDGYTIQYSKSDIFGIDLDASRIVDIPVANFSLVELEFVVESYYVEKVEIMLGAGTDNPVNGEHAVIDNRVSLSIASQSFTHKGYIVTVTLYDGTRTFIYIDIKKN